MKQPSYGRGIETSIQIKETEGFCFKLTPIVINPARSNLPNFIWSSPMPIEWVKLLIIRKLGLKPRPKRTALC
jgi:hypothetical protein